MKINVLGIIIVPVLILLLTKNKGQAQVQPVFKGTVVEYPSQEPLVGVLVRYNDSGVLTDSLGGFRFTLSSTEPDTITVTLVAEGYWPAIHRLTAGNDMRIFLTPRLTELAAQVITGTQRKTNRKDSPINVEVITREAIHQQPVYNLNGIMAQVTGSQVINACGVCGTTDIRLNGMGAGSTLLLMDGIPLGGGLSAVYGLSGIPASLIERIELVRGPASTLYGTEALGGVVNVMTRDTDCAPRLLLDQSLSSAGQYTADVLFSKQYSRLQALTAIHYLTLNQRHDLNNDSFTDLPLVNRLSVFQKLRYKTRLTEAVRLGLRFYTEDRFGGQVSWQAQDRGQLTVYGESILTRRGELTAYIPTGKSSRIEAGSALHHQNSVYGQMFYKATQAVSLWTWLFDSRLTARQNLLTGLSARHWYYDDNTPATVQPENRFIPGIFAEHDFHPSDRWNCLTGLRLDYQSVHGWVTSPRFNLRFSPTPLLQLRLNAGTGFRMVNAFTEDHAALTGSRQLVFINGLLPERTQSVSLHATRYFGRKNALTTVNIDGFFTRFLNILYADYQTNPDQIIYRNLTGINQTTGAVFEIRQQWTAFANTSVGLAYNHAMRQESADTPKLPVYFMPTWSGTMSAGMVLKRPGIIIDYTGRWVGSQYIPSLIETNTNGDKVSGYAIHTLQIRKTWRQLTITLACENILNFRQANPLVHPEAPFSSQFDASRIYAPIFGRQAFLTLSYQRPK